MNVPPSARLTRPFAAASLLCVVNRPTPNGTPAQSPTPANHVFRDEVCVLPDPDPIWRRLVYYTSDGKPSWEKRVPISANMADQQLELLREGREWHAKRRQNRIHLMRQDRPEP